MPDWQAMQAVSFCLHLDSAAMPLEKLGPYRVVRLLGRGGMGAVYEGIHEESQQRVALKTLAAAYVEDEAFRARFVAEIEALKTLRHPNIVRLIGFGEQDGTLFFAMELVEGASLHQLLRSGRQFSWVEVVDIAVQVAGALKHAHDHGIIHRDLKPANLLRSSDGLVKLTDFGIAKLFGATHVTTAGSVIGTIDYMAPEQAEGAGVSARSDLYSLGAVMYTLLAGRPPYVGNTATEVYYKMRHHPPEDLARLAPHAPQPLAELVMELLERDPEKRVPTALVLSKRLRAMLHALGSATPPSACAADAPSVTGAPQGTALGSKTELGPTREVDPQQLDPISWQRETIFTANPEIQPAKELEDTSAELRLRDEPEAVESAPRTRQDPLTRLERSTRATGGHFTEVDQWTADAARKVVPRRRPDARFPTSQVLSVIGLLAGLVLLAALAWYLRQPPPADRLFSRIQQVVAQSPTGDYMYARDDIELFLTHYPDDARADQVRRWQVEHDAFRLWRKLERRADRAGGIEFLPKIEQDFVVAMREEGRDPGKAGSLFEQLVEKYSQQPDASADAAPCVELARQKARYLIEDHSGNVPRKAIPPQPTSDALPGSPAEGDSGERSENGQ
ncbi:MAG: serine/threonine protein kinase [Pirellulaceae bacterium]|nr:MAG: serine/threonine protein kinase [Pirellulaceae bacterium]